MSLPPIVSFFMKFFPRRRSLALLLPIGVIFVILGPYAQKAMIPDNSLSVWFLENDPKLNSYNQFQESFGNDEIVLMNIPFHMNQPDKEFVRFQSTIKKIESMNAVFKVHSIFDFQDAVDTEYGLRFQKIIPANFAGTPEQAKKLWQQIADVKGVKGRLISKDTSSTSVMLWVQMKVLEDFDAKRDAIVEELTTLMSQEPHFKDRDIMMGGTGIIYSALNKTTQEDSTVFAGAGFLLMFAMMLFVFRSGWYLAAAASTILGATSLTLGFYGYFDHHINMVTVILPTLITVLGLADVVHFPPAFAAARSKKPTAPRGEVAFDAAKSLFMPCLLTSITTIVGFLSLVSAPMAVIRQLGMYAALGIAIAFAISFLYMIIAWVNLEPTKDHGEEGRRFAWIHGCLSATTRLVVSNPLKVLAGCALVFAIALVGISQLKVDTFTIGYLPKDHKVVVDHNKIESTWGYYSPVEFIIKPLEGKSMADAELLNATEAFAKEVGELGEVSSDYYGLPVVFRRLATVLGGKTNTEEFTPALASQLRLVLDSNRLEWRHTKPKYKDNFLAPLTDESYSIGRITFTGKMVSAATLRTKLAVIETIADKHFKGIATVSSAGYVPLYAQIIDYIIESQLSSFALALGLIFLIMLLWLRSLPLALISLIPNLFPVTFVLGMMGFLGINLDIATAVVSAIIIGISIDDTVHFFHHWQKGEAEGLSWQDNVGHTLQTAGVPATITTMILLAGYPVLMLAQVGSVVSFGILISIAAIMALSADVLLLPTVLYARSRLMQSEGRKKNA